MTSKEALERLTDIVRDIGIRNTLLAVAIIADRASAHAERYGTPELSQAYAWDADILYETVCRREWAT